MQYAIVIKLYNKWGKIMIWEWLWQVRLSMFGFLKFGEKKNGYIDKLGYGGGVLNDYFFGYVTYDWVFPQLQG